MRLLLAFDKFKGSLTASEACAAAARGFARAAPDAEIVSRPVADGGDGTLDALEAALPDVERREVEAWDALKLRRAPTSYLISEKDSIAYVEMALASGLVRLGDATVDPLNADTFGTGEVVRAAIDAGAKQVVIGLGGSATNDGGVGMARAFGFRFLDRDHVHLTALPADLAKIARIEPPPFEIGDGVRLLALADVDNPLLGRLGATRVFGPQKGVDEWLTVRLEDGLAHLAEVVARDLGCDHRAALGSGAAGGLAFGLMSFFGAELRPGFEHLSEAMGLREAIAAADAVVVGEGRLDQQTLSGKAPAGVAAMARELGKRVYAIGGAVDADARAALEERFDGVAALQTGRMTTKESMAFAADLLEAHCAKSNEVFAANQA